MGSQSTHSKEKTKTYSGVGKFRQSVSNIIESKRWEFLITAAIVLNGITLGLETSPTIMGHIGQQLKIIDHIFLGLFVIELVLRIFVHRLQFFKDPWSLFDFAVVSVSLLPASGNLSILRAFRILRVLRLISAIESVRNVVSGLLHALPGMGSISILLGLICYVFAVMSTKLFGARFPEEFGTIGHSIYTLFQIMTLDGWSSEVVRPVMKEYPWAPFFFIVFILATTFTVLNLFIGIIVEAMQSQRKVEQEKEQAWEEKEFDTVLAEIRSLKSEIQSLKASMSGKK